MDNQRKGIALDIDDTIANTSLACMVRLLEVHGHEREVDPYVLLAEHGYPHLVPEWQLPRCIQTLNDMHTGPELYKNAEAIPEAVYGVHILQEIVPVRCYITSRLEELKDVTQIWLKEHLFPDAPLICRPPHVMEPDWKIRYLVEHKFDLLALIDNELYVPEDVDFSFELLELVQRGKLSPPHRAIVECRDWHEIVAKVQAIAAKNQKS